MILPLTSRDLDLRYCISNEDSGNIVKLGLAHLYGQILKTTKLNLNICKYFKCFQAALS